MNWKVYLLGSIGGNYVEIDYYTDMSEAVAARIARDQYGKNVRIIAEENKGETK